MKKEWRGHPLVSTTAGVNLKLSVEAVSFTLEK